jgi:hypothetical protein
VTTLAENLTMGAIFTAVSIARSYCRRRASGLVEVKMPPGTVRYWRN